MLRSWQLLSFKDSLPSHIRFVEHCFLDFEVFNKTRSKSLLVFVRTLNKAAGLPHRATCLKIIGVIRTLIEQKLHSVILKHIAAFAAPCAGMQSDIWSEKSMRESFFAARLSMQLEPHLIYSAGSTGLALHAGTLVDAAPMITFEAFQESSHSGAVIAQVKRKSLSKFSLAPRHITLPTEDGAANNKKSAKILQMPFEVCLPHNLQRCVLFSTGMTGSPSKNPLLAAEIKKMSAMAAAPHRSVQLTKSLQDFQVAAGTKKANVLTTSSMNATRWQGLYRMVNKNRRLENVLKASLTGSEAGLEGMMEEPAEVGELADGDEESDADDEGLPSGDEDEAQIQANVAADRKYPLAHRCLDAGGFRNGSVLESLLTHPQEVSAISQKHEGMGLSMGYQMAQILHEGATSPRVSLVSGTSKEGGWTDVHASTLPDMFKTQRDIFAKELDARFKVKGTPSKLTLLALRMDPSVNTTWEQGIFASRSAAQELMEGEYRRALLRRAHSRASTSGGGSSGARATPAEGATPILPPAKRNVPSSGQTGSAKKGPASIHMLMSSKGKAPANAATPEDSALELVKMEEVKYEQICMGVEADSRAYMEHGLFDQGKFWAAQKHALPLHYAVWVAEVGCAKLASANVETVFSGAGRISNRSRTLAAQVLSDYCVCHYNYNFDWLRPQLDEIIKAYHELYGPQPRDSDAEESASSSDGEEEEQEECEGEEAEGEEAA